MSEEVGCMSDRTHPVSTRGRYYRFIGASAAALFSLNIFSGCALHKWKPTLDPDLPKEEGYSALPADISTPTVAPPQAKVEGVPNPQFPGYFPTSTVAPFSESQATRTNEGYRLQVGDE